MSSVASWHTICYRSSVFIPSKMFRYDSQLFNWSSWFPPVIVESQNRSRAGFVGAIRTPYLPSSFLNSSNSHFSQPCLFSIGNHQCSVWSWNSTSVLIHSIHPKASSQCARRSLENLVVWEPGRRIQSWIIVAPPGNQAANGENKPQPLVFGGVKPVHSTHYIINDFIFLSLTIVLFGIRDIHDFQHGNPLNVNKLVQNKALSKLPRSRVAGH